MSNVVELKPREIPSDLMSFDEVARKYKIKYHTLYKYACRLNQITYIKRGGLRVSEKDIIDWLADGKVQARY